MRTKNLNPSFGMIGSRGRRLKDESGAALVEMALTCSILVMLLLGLFEMTLAFYAYHYVSDAARECSRWAIVRGSTSCTNTPTLSGIVCPTDPSQPSGATEDEIANYVKTLGYPGIDSANLMNVTVETSQVSADNTTWASCGEGTSCNAPGDQVRVTVTYNFPLNVPFWRSVILPVTSSSSMVFSQ